MSSVMILWSLLCNYPDQCSSEAGRKCGYGLLTIEDLSSCVTHVLAISVDILFLVSLLCFFIYKSFSTKVVVRAIMSSKSQLLSPLMLSSVIFNGLIGLAYLGCGVFMVIEKLRTDRTVLPLHGWLAMTLQGFTWLLLGLTISLKKLSFHHTRPERLGSVLALLFAGFLFTSSIWEAVVYKAGSVNTILDILSFPGAFLLLFCSFSGHNDVEDNETTQGFYKPLEDEEEASNVTPFATSWFLSTMTFCWLNPLMKEGKKKVLGVEDVPRLRRQDRAKTCYLMFMEKLSKRAQDGSSDPASILSVIISCHWKAILITGFLALIKVIALSTGPILLGAFINASEGETTFKHEGYVLALALFAEKCFESLSERQWFFQTRLMGLQVRSLLSAAIYQKQLCLSNAAKMDHSAGEIMSYITVDAFRIGEFPYWFHQIWSTSLQLCLALVIVYHSIGLATFGALLALILTTLVSYPLGKLQHKYQTKLMSGQDRRLKAIIGALTNMKVLKLYAWEKHFKNIIGELRKEESQWILSILNQRSFYSCLFWSSPLLVSTVTIWVCYFLGITLNASNLFTFLACIRLAQQPIRLIPDVAGVFIEAKVSLHRIEKFLKAPELENKYVRQARNGVKSSHSIFICCDEISWETSSVKATLRNINLVISPGEKVAICGEVGSGKSTLLAAILGEVPHINGTVLVHGKIAYVSQTGWIQSGTIQENILFGSVMDHVRYQEVLEKCSLTKDLSMFSFGDLTQLGERGVNLSGGQKQRVQLARALYQSADVYLLDDPFSAVDAHTATSLFNGYVMEALAGKTVLLVTHQVDFLPAFNSVLLMSAGEILRAASYDQLLETSNEFQNLVNAHNEIAVSEKSGGHTSMKISEPSKEVIHNVQLSGAAVGDQLIKQEEKEVGDTGLKPYIQYINQDRGLLFFSLAFVLHILFVGGQLIQNYWLATEIENTYVSRLKLVTVYSLIGCVLSIILFARSTCTVLLGYGVSKAMFSTLMTSLFRAPMSFYDSTPIGRILSRVSYDLSIIDVDIASKLSISIGSTMNTYAVLAVLGIITWPVLLVIIPTLFLCALLQRYYFASAKEFMRMNGTTKSLVTSHVSESIAGVMTIRAFGEEERFFSKTLDLIDVNASAYFHSFSANEWLIQRLEILCALVLSSSALAMTLLKLGASAPGFAGMALAYGLSLNTFLVTSVQQQCLLENSIISVERLEQYMHLPSEAPEVIKDSRPSENWPSAGKVEICDLKVRYRPSTPLVLRGISCIIEGGHNVGIVGRTGSGKTTLISVLFRLVEPTEGKIIVDGLDISTIGLHDLRSRFGIIPQEPTLFSGSVRYNLDPLSEHTDIEIWEVLKKCQLHGAIQDKEEGLDSIVAEDGSNWSMGQRQLFCLGRALLKRSRLLVLDEATASIDNATDSILQKTIRTEFADCTVITVAHRVPTVMDCDMVLAISDGKVVEYEEPMKLIKQESSLFGQLYEEYWSRGTNEV